MQLVRKKKKKIIKIKLYNRKDLYGRKRGGINKGMISGSVITDLRPLLVLCGG